jgi:RimJ/RimL family protein N-acetyltransferase
MDKIITKNLKIRKFTKNDVNIYFINNNDAQVRKYMPDHSHDNVEKAYDEISGFLQQYIEMKMPYHFAIIKDDILIGHIGIGDSDIGCGIFEICCAINKDNRGLGYATEAIKAFVPWCKHTFGIDKIYASMSQENIASSKTAQNAGFKLTNIKHKDKNFKIYEFC